MATKTVKDGNFRDLYQNNDILILDFWAEWCGPCHQFAPIFEEVSNEDSEVIFGKVNTEEEVKLSQYFSIRSIPTIIVIREQIEVFRHSGVIGAVDLRNLLAEVKSIDMNKLNQQIDQESND